MLQYTTPSKAPATGAGVSGVEVAGPPLLLHSVLKQSTLKQADGNAQNQNGVLGFASVLRENQNPNVQNSVLKTGLARRVHDQSAIKGDTAAAIAKAVDHFSLFDRVSALESERENMRTELGQLREQNRQLTARLGEAEAFRQQVLAAQAAEAGAAGDAGAPLDPSALSKEDLLAKLKAVQMELVTAHQERRRAHNALVEAKGAIRVYCRVRPVDAFVAPCARVDPQGTGLSVSCYGSDHAFAFNHVFPAQASQQAVFNEVSDLVQSSLDGHHVCLFSYGQTGSGKTHNMMGPSTTGEGRGIIPRAIEKIFEATQRGKLMGSGWHHAVEISAIEVYQDRLRDLLDTSAKEVSDMNAIKHEARGTHTLVAGISRTSVSNVSQALTLVQRAASVRTSHSTAMNASSSRSHCVIMMYLSSSHAESGTVQTGALCLVDLAGSERLARSQAEGSRKAEACAINASLSALGDVFEALSAATRAGKQQLVHVPHRNSKLTYLLKPCLSPGGKTLMFVHVNPEPASAYESLTSLRFATKVAGVEMKPGQGLPAALAPAAMAAPASASLAVRTVSRVAVQQQQPAASMPAMALGATPSTTPGFASRQPLQPQQPASGGPPGSTAAGLSSFARRIELQPGSAGGAAASEGAPSGLGLGMPPMRLALGGLPAVPEGKSLPLPQALPSASRQLVGAAQGPASVSMSTRARRRSSLSSAGAGLLPLQLAQPQAQPAVAAAPAPAPASAAAAEATSVLFTMGSTGSLPFVFTAGMSGGSSVGGARRTRVARRTSSAALAQQPRKEELQLQLEDVEEEEEEACTAGRAGVGMDLRSGLRRRREQDVRPQQPGAAAEAEDAAAQRKRRKTGAWY